MYGGRGRSRGAEPVRSFPERGGCQSFDDDELPVDNILAFITYDDAHRYKTFLESVTNMSTRVECVPRIALEISYYHTMVVDEGAIIFPPLQTVEVTDWEKRNALINGRWSVREKC